MKEVTFKDWQKNPTPRMMWVWDNNIRDKVKRKVIYIIDNDKISFPVVALNETQVTTSTFIHCAEIEESKTRRYTNQELAWWVREKPTREYKYKRNDCSTIYFEYFYTEENANTTVDSDVLIREDGGEWHEPLVEVEE